MAGIRRAAFALGSIAAIVVAWFIIGASIDTGPRQYITVDQLMADDIRCSEPMELDFGVLENEYPEIAALMLETTKSGSGPWSDSSTLRDEYGAFVENYGLHTCIATYDTFFIVTSQTVVK